jgi:2-polyprenyl-6-methoxyphenol hydroxylase-like FAD-dependent oxidoreductase
MRAGNDEMRMRVLISGAGIAGPTLAWWLMRSGAEVTIVERAPRLRTGGYIIDFWGAGYDVAERMGLIPEIRAKGYMVRDVRIVDDEGRRVSGFPAESFARSTHGRFTSVPRGDLAALIFEQLRGRVEIMFGDTVEAIEDTGGEVRVGFEREGERSFDLVIGADGLHSAVRRIVFGPDDRFEHYLGFKVAAFTVEGYRPRDELVYLMYTEVGQQICRFSMRDDRTMFLMTFADSDPALPPTAGEQKAVLRQRFGNSGWESRAILEALDQAGELYFDTVSQIRIDPADGWASRGRVALIGDAASCVSLLAGEGSGLAMAAAYIVGGELRRSGGDHAAAFARYRDLFQPFVAKKQRAAVRFAKSFAPPSRWALFVRNQVFRLMAIPLVVGIVAGSALTGDIALPD